MHATRWGRPRKATRTRRSRRRNSGRSPPRRPPLRTLRAAHCCGVACTSRRARDRARRTCGVHPSAAPFSCAHRISSGRSPRAAARRCTRPRASRRCAARPRGSSVRASRGGGWVGNSDAHARACQRERETNGARARGASPPPHHDEVQQREPDEAERVLALPDLVARVGPRRGAQREREHRGRLRRGDQQPRLVPTGRHDGVIELGGRPRGLEAPRGRRRARRDGTLGRLEARLVGQVDARVLLHFRIVLRARLPVADERVVARAQEEHARCEGRLEPGKRPGGSGHASRGDARSRASRHGVA